MTSARGGLLGGKLGRLEWIVTVTAPKINWLTMETLRRGVALVFRMTAGRAGGEEGKWQTELLGD